MYILKKRIEIAGAHCLKLSYDSPCSNLHGHNWVIEVEVKSEKLNRDGMIIDFGHIKKIVNQLDHAYLNNLIDNPTAENIAAWLFGQITNKLKEDGIGAYVSNVSVLESEGNLICYTE